MPPRRQPGQRQHRDVLPAVPVHHVNRGAAQGQRGGQQRPRLPGQPGVHAGPHDLPAPAEPGAAGRAVQPGGQDQLDGAHPVQVPAQLGGVVVHPADGVVARRPLAQRGRLEHRAQPQHPHPVQDRRAPAAGLIRTDHAVTAIGHDQPLPALSVISTVATTKRAPPRPATSDGTRAGPSPARWPRARSS